MANADPLKVRTGEVRLSYASLFEARCAPGSNVPKYSVVLLIPKTDKATLKALKNAELAAIDQGKETKWRGKIPPNLKSIIHDGDEEKDLDENPEYAGHMYMSVSANEKYPPLVIDRNKQEIMNPAEVYSGAYGIAILRAYPYSASGNNGVSFGLNALQKTRDGERLGGTGVSLDDFEDLGELDEDDDDLF